MGLKQLGAKLLIQMLRRAGGLSALMLTLPAMADSTADQIAAVKAQLDDAIFQAQHIINQPVMQLKQTADMQVLVYHPCWFHPGAETPDFDHVDVRTTRQLSYQGEQYVSSDLNPGVVFLGDQLEFNSMTKCFYTDRSVPKKKLTEEEMLKINDLYRVIGRCNHQLDELQHPTAAAVTQTQGWLAAHKPLVMTAAVVLLMVLIVKRMKHAPQADDE